MKLGVKLRTMCVIAATPFSGPALEQQLEQEGYANQRLRILIATVKRSLGSMEATPP